MKYHLVYISRVQVAYNETASYKGSLIRGTTGANPSLLDLAFVENIYAPN